MALEAFRDSISQSPMPVILPLNAAGGILQALTSDSSLQDEEDLHSIISMAHLDTNFGSDVTNSTIMGNSSTSGSATGHVANLTRPTDVYLQSHVNTTMEPYVSLPSYPVSFSSDNPMNIFYTDDTFSHLCQSREKDSKKQHLGNTIGSANLYKTKVQTHHNSLPSRIKQEIFTYTPSLKKPRIDVNQVNIHQQQDFIQKLLLKEVQEYNPQLKEVIKQCRQKVQMQQPILQPASHLRGFRLQMPKQQIRSLQQGQVNQQETFSPLLDGDICSRRFKQYLYHLRNNRHDNSISYWKKFVSEYYAADSKKRWCFSKYENIELHTAGVFSPKSMETWCCQICASKSGKGLEATSEIFPRLFKIKFESGMLDEILFLDSPRVRKVSHGVVLEYRRVIQESVYETFRVVHKGILRIVFGLDLKILSWEFCIENHDEYLLHALFSPQVNQLVQAVDKYQEIQNCAYYRASSQDLRKVCDTFVSAGTQIIKNMELPLVNDLGYPKRFIRCLQIAEIVDSMRGLISFNHNTKMGPIECLNNYSQGIKTDNQIKGKQEMEQFVGALNQEIFNEQLGPGFHAYGSWMSENSVDSGSGNSGLAFLNQNHQLHGLNSSVASARRNWQESCITDHANWAVGFGKSLNSYLHNEAPPFSSEHGKIRDQVLVDKMLREIVASNMGKSVQGTYKELDNEVAQQSNQTSATNKELCYRESHNAATAPMDLADSSRAVVFSKACSHANSSTFSQKLTAKAEPYSPERLPEAFHKFSSTFLYN